MSEPAPILERRFNGLVTKIHNGECVLVLGPRILVPTEVTNGVALSLESYLAERLLEDLATDAGSNTSVGLRSAVARYERVHGASACRSFMQELVSQFDVLTTALHQDLARLPFRLVLSAAPDRMIAEAFRTQGKLQVQEACYNYPRGVAAQNPLSAPSCEAPIIYSLFGRHDHPESMVLDDKNLLDYLVRVVKECPALPDAVRATLRAPSTVFLFFGFGFTNWWLRLLLKVLEVTGVENRGLSLALEDQSSFDATQLAESRGFYEAAGIYIRARDDWPALAQHLANTYQAIQARQRFPNSDRPQLASAPLVFLSHASEDALRVDTLREALERQGVRVWLDKQNLRAGQNWKHQIDRIINSVDYFVFVQSSNMDARDASGRDGVYNWELKAAIERQMMRPHGAVFLLHAMFGACAKRPEAELLAVHSAQLDSDAQIRSFAEDILRIHRETRTSPPATATAQVG